MVATALVAHQRLGAEQRALDPRVQLVEARAQAALGEAELEEGGPRVAAELGVEGMHGEVGLAVPPHPQGDAGHIGCVHAPAHS